MERERYLKMFVTIMVLGALLRVALIVVSPMGSYEDMKHKRGDEQFYFQIGESIATKGEFTEGYLKAYRPPGYPFFIALHWFVFPGKTLPVQISQNVLFLLAAMIQARVVERLCGRGAALWSLVFVLTNPTWAIHCQRAYSEPLFTFLLVAAIALFERLSRGGGRWPMVVALGLTLGAAALVREVGLYFGLGMALTLLLVRRKTVGLGPAFGQAALVGCGMLAVILPWTARNYHHFHAVVPITSNSNINLYLGNNPDANGHYLWRMPDHVYPFWNTPGTGASNERFASGECGKAAVRYILDNPGTTVARWPKKVWYLWGPNPGAASTSTIDRLYRLARFVHWPPYFALALWGVWLLRREPVGWYLIALLVLTTGIHAMTYVIPHYRAPQEFVFAIPASCAVVWLVNRWRPSAGEASREPEAVAG